MTGFFRILLISLCLLPTLAARAAAQDMRAAAVVNDEIISIFDLEMRTRLAIASTGQRDTPELRQRILPQVLRTLIDERIQSQEATRLGIEVSDEELDRAIDQIAARNKMPTDSFTQMLRSRGILPQTLRDQVKAEIMWQMLVARRLRPSVQITEEEIDDEVERIVANQGGVQRQVAEIFLSVDTAQEEARIRENAERLYEQLRAGANFAAVAREFSESATAAQGGVLGWVPEGRLPEEVEAALARMRPGMVSTPIRSLSGYHIVYLQDIRQVTAGDVTLGLVQVLVGLPEVAGEEQRQAAVARAQAAAQQINGCDNAEEVARTLGDTGSGNLGNVRLVDLPQSIRRAVASLEIGQPSQPVAVGGGLAVLVVCDREESGVDRDRIEQRLASERLDMMVRRYLRDLRRSANVDIRI
jgi:peptidyl-prolyl cis-trans isomerase SurA